MRKILISDKDEFKKVRKSDYRTSAAVKMLASLIHKSEKNDESERVETYNHLGYNASQRE